MPGSEQSTSGASASMAKSISANSVAKAADKKKKKKSKDDDDDDPVSSYKRKVFYRRLKAIVLGLTALTLLLAGCLLGFVLPASIDVAGQERGNSSRALGHQALNNSAPVASTNGSVENSTQTNTTSAPAEINSPHNNATTTTTQQPPPSAQKATTKLNKWLAINWHDTNQKQTTPTSVYKWWLMNWKDHVENTLQKEKMRNASSGSSTGEKRPMHPFIPQSRPSVTTLPPPPPVVVVPPAAVLSIEEVNKQLPPTTQNPLNLTLISLNQTTRANVRRVTSYPQSNITTTPPSVITRHV